ncbi:hypothetical protein ACFVHQ_16970 [Actinomycetes bacterium NPDC127524]
MNKEQYLHQLDVALKRLPAHERKDILWDYEEHFANGIEEGKSEERISASLGSPQQNAKELLASYHIGKAEKKVTTGNILRATWAALGLGFFNIVFILGPVIGIAGAMAAGWISGAAFILSPLMVLVGSAINRGTFEWYDLFFSMGLCGAGLFILIGMYYATYALVRGLIRYLKFNASVVKGGLNRG